MSCLRPFKLQHYYLYLKLLGQLLSGETLILLNARRVHFFGVVQLVYINAKRGAHPSRITAKAISVIH